MEKKLIMTRQLLKEYNFHEVIKLFHLNGQMIFNQHIVFEIQDTTYSAHGAFFSDWMTENLMEILPQTGDAAIHTCEHEDPLLAACATHAFGCCLLLMAVTTCSDVKITNLTPELFECVSVCVWVGGIERRTARFINQNTMGWAWKSKWAS